jgi:hypothetical protein
MGGPWDGKPRTVGFFLEENPMGICEVVAQLQDDATKLNLQGNCREAFNNRRMCKHTKHVAFQFHLNGDITIALDPSVPPSVIEEARSDSETFRELLIARGQVQVLDRSE